jgi:transglutaminase-like putative cysteine protease
MAMALKNLEEYLLPTYYINAESKVIVDLAKELVTKQATAIEKAKAFFYWTRDKIVYDPYTCSFSKTDYKASKIVKKGRGWCVQKAVVLAALARAVGIPSRLHFADIRNYQVTPKLKQEMGTDLFIFHGYTEIYLDKWVKATPAFNIELCQKFGYKPVEFDGVNDAILPSTTLKGERHVEYLKDRDAYADLPLEEIFTVFKEVYSFAGANFSKR